jgi:prolyl-tRNA synthetase
MKDMYSFDMDETTAMQTYNLVRDAYDWFFNSIGLPFVTVSHPFDVAKSRPMPKVEI